MFSQLDVTFFGRICYIINMLHVTEKILLNNLIMIFLAVFSVFLLVVDVLFPLSESDKSLVHNLDFFVALSFLAEFAYNLYHTSDRREFLKKYWWELLAAIPFTNHTTQLLRSLKLIRIMPVLEVLRFVRLAVRLKIIIDESRKRTKQAYIIYIMIIIMILVTAAASVFFQFENGVNPNVNNFGDSLWWAIVTLTTIGYGDIYPHTPEGRIVAVFLMLTGIAALGAFVAAIDTYVVKSILLKSK